MPKTKSHRKPAATKTPGKQSPLTPAQEKDLCDLYQKGGTLHELALKFGLGSNAMRVSRILREHKVKVRSRGRRIVALSDSDRAKAKAAYEKGGAIVDLAEQFKIAPTTMRRELLAAGTSIRKVGRASTGKPKAKAAKPKAPKAPAKPKTARVAKPKAAKPKAPKAPAKPKPKGKSAFMKAALREATDKATVKPEHPPTPAPVAPSEPLAAKGDEPKTATG